ncbi:hypothetical protein IAQ61_009225 [Plenodomus lingam]|uniref:uncharacterized protein n=1 Tax=Leptosphaeria maculans TaxID=5022 RepID=UPI003332475C|nr:hypothetical protein IAQ61_009225 [Plenodomus lingam]
MQHRPGTRCNNPTKRAGRSPSFPRCLLPNNHRTRDCTWCTSSTFRFTAIPSAHTLSVESANRSLCERQQ